MAGDATTRSGKKSKRKVPKWLWRQAVIQLVIYELAGLMNAIGALLILVKAGILQLTQINLLSAVVFYRAAALKLGDWARRSTAAHVNLTSHPALPRPLDD